MTALLPPSLKHIAFWAFFAFQVMYARNPSLEQQGFLCVLPRPTVSVDLTDQVDGLIQVWILHPCNRLRSKKGDSRKCPAFLSLCRAKWIPSSRCGISSQIHHRTLSSIKLNIAALYDGNTPPNAFLFRKDINSQTNGLILYRIAHGLCVSQRHRTWRKYLYLRRYCLW